MMSSQKISASLRRQIDKELEAGESIKWIEQPVHRFLTAQSLGQFMMGIPFTVFSIFWMYGAAGFKIPDLSEGIKYEHLFSLFGIPFVLFGLWMLLSPFREWLKAFRAVYLITDKRAISIENGWFVTIRSYMPSQLNELYRKQRRDGTGDVVITTRLRKGNEGSSWTEEIGFLNVRDPQQVERLLQQLANLRA